MRALIQRVGMCSVHVDGKSVAAIRQGILVFLGVSCDDDHTDVSSLAKRIAFIRVFPSPSNAPISKDFEQSIMAFGGEIMVVSQFTLYAENKKGGGRRPNFIKAARPDVAEGLYKAFVEELRTLYAHDRIKTGTFGAKMDVSLINDGPVTLMLDSCAS